MLENDPHWPTRELGRSDISSATLSPKVCRGGAWPFLGHCSLGQPADQWETENPDSWNPTWTTSKMMIFFCDLYASLEIFFACEAYRTRLDLLLSSTQGWWQISLPENSEPPELVHELGPPVPQLLLRCQTPHHT